MLMKKEPLIPKIGVDIEPDMLPKVFMFEQISICKKEGILSWMGADYREDFGIIRDVHHFKFIKTSSDEILIKAYLSSKLVNPSLSTTSTFA